MFLAIKKYKITFTIKTLFQISNLNSKLYFFTSVPFHYKAFFIVFLLLVKILSLNSQEILLYESFENGYIPSNWTLVDADNDGNNWEIHTATSGHTGQYSVASYSWFNEQVLTPNNWLITPPLTLKDSTLLKFYVKPVSLTYVSEKYFVKVSTTSNQINQFNYTLLEETINFTDWREKIVNLSQFKNQTVYIAFVHAQVSNQFALKIDDIKIETFELLSSAETEKKLIKIFPNPVTDKIFIEEATEKILQIRIFDIEGTKLFEKNDKEIDVIDWPAGIYIIQIITHSQILNFKLIKN